MPGVCGRREFEAVGVCLVDDRRANHAAVDERNATLRQAFEIERERHERIVDGVVREREVFAEQLFAEVADEEGGAVVEGVAAERDHVQPLEHFRKRGWFEDDVERAGLQIVGDAGFQRCFQCCFVAEGEDVDVFEVAGDGGCISRLSAANRNHRRLGRAHRRVAANAMCVRARNRRAAGAVRAGEVDAVLAAAIEHLAQRARFCDRRNGGGFRIECSEERRCFVVAIEPGEVLQRAGVSRGFVRQRGGVRDAVVIKRGCRRDSHAAVDDHAHGQRGADLRHVLVYARVRKAADVLIGGDECGVRLGRVRRGQRAFEDRV